MSKTTSDIRVRFAPSPTGHLHIGSVRVALFNWLFARHHGGTYLVRMEDTDTERSSQEYFSSILDALKWVSLESDEQLVVQSTRTDLYKKVITQLLDEGKAYRCFVTEAEVEAYKKESMHAGTSIGYRSPWRDKIPTEHDLEKPYTIRFKVSTSQSITFSDLVHGDITFDVSQIDDFVIQRSDGMPTYNFVVVVDDHDMNISHVIRGEDHISNTPKQILLYDACGYKTPEFAHLPLILGPSGERLSKRDAAVSVLDYRRNGYLPDALCNYLVRLGWSHGDQELFTRDEMISYFSLDHVGKTGAIFDHDKLHWLNTTYMRDTSSDVLLSMITDSVQPDFLKQVHNFTDTQVISFIDLYKERSKTLQELVDTIVSLHSSSRKLPDDILSEWATEQVITLLTNLRGQLSSISAFDHDELSSVVKAFCKSEGVGLAKVAKPLRLALTGSLSSPGIFALLSCIGKEESLQRITNFVTLLQTIRKSM